MKKQAHYSPDTPIKASAQAAGYLREDFRDLDHEESWLRKNKIAFPLGYKERSGPCWPRIPFLLTRYLFATKSIFS